MTSIEDVLLLHAPHDRRHTSKGWISFNCPCCVAAGEPRPDSRRRGGLYLVGQEVRYNCFNCGTSASWKPGEALDRRMRFVMRCMGVSDRDIDRIKFEIARSRLSSKVSDRSEPKNRPNFAETPLPEYSRPLTEWLGRRDCPPEAIEVAEYLLRRRIAGHWRYYWSPSMRVEMYRRVIVPFYHRGKIVGWTARTIDADVLPRYYSSTRPDYLFNIDLLEDRERKYVCLVEGPLDAIAVDGIATMGKSISPQQAAWINQSGKSIVVLPDRDPSKRSLIDHAEVNHWLISFPWEFYGGDGLWERDVKDAAQAVERYGRIYAIKSILERAHTNYKKIPLMKKRIRER